jgi:1-deoxy-D-xylulose-5-phosphate synthase
MWDMSILQVVPGLRLTAPRDGARLRELLREALSVDDAPTVIRVPKGPVAPDTEPIERVGGIDVMRRAGDERVLIVGFGPMVGVAADVAERLHAQGIGVVVVDPRWAKPLDPALADLARPASLVVTIEDNVRTGGCGAAIAQLLRDHDVGTQVEVLGIPERFLDHAKRAAILQQVGLDPQSVARRVIELVAQAESARTKDELPQS